MPTAIFKGGQDVTDTEDEDVFDEEELPPASFTRGGFKPPTSGNHLQIDGKAVKDDSQQQPARINNAMPRNSSSLARLSMFIRRSLRLPSRSRQSEADFKWDRQTMESARSFTSNSLTKMGPSEVPNRLDEILENKRLNRQEKVKTIVRKMDWPPRHEIRQTLWKELCRGKDFDSSRCLYLEELENVKRTKRTTHPHFLKEDGVVIHNFDLNERGALNLMRLLTVIERMRPEVSSAPILYPLCALMLHFLDDADVFACVQYLLSNKGFIMTSPIQWAAAPYTILALIKKHKSNAYSLLKRRLNTDDDQLIVRTLTDWLSWIFGGLPLMHVCRVVDCFLVEGHKFFIRTAISIVYIWSKMQKSGQFEDLSGKSQDERISVIKGEFLHTAQHIGISTDTFILTAIKIRNLRSSNIARLQAQYEEKMKSEWGKRHSVVRQRGDMFTESFASQIVEHDVAIDIMAALPPRLQLATPEKLFQLSEDGASFTKLWSFIDEAPQTLIIIRTAEGDIFGAFCSSPWAERNDRRERSKTKYFGTGESFVWRLDRKLGFPVIYFWAGRDAPQHGDYKDIPQMFMTAGDRLLVVGSGGGDAIRISEELTQGMSRACTTFNSPPLVDSESFIIDELEVFEVLTNPKKRNVADDETAPSADQQLHQFIQKLQ